MADRDVRALTCEHKMIAYGTGSDPSSATDDDDAQKWAAAVAQAWANDWSDPREDIYTLEDGEPLDR
jgi:hypothetical protein